MISKEALEEAVLAMLCFSEEHAATVSLRIRDERLFSNRTNQQIAKVCLHHVSKFGRAPGGQLEYLLENELRRGEEGKLISQSLALFQKQVGQLQPEFVIQQLDHFIETQQLQSSL